MHVNALAILRHLETSLPILLVLQEDQVFLVGIIDFLTTD